MALEGLREKLGPLPVWTWGAIGGVGVGVYLLARRGTPSQTPTGTSLNNPNAFGSGSDALGTIAAQLDQLNSNIRQINITPPPPIVPPPITPPPTTDATLNPWLGTTNYFEHQLENLRYNLTLPSNLDVFTNPNDIANHLNLAAHSIDYTQSPANVQAQQVLALNQFKSWLDSHVQLGSAPNAQAYQGYLEGWLSQLQTTIQNGATNTAAQGSGLQTPRVGMTDTNTGHSSIVTSTAALRV